MTTPTIEKIKQAVEEINHDVLECQPDKPKYILPVWWQSLEPVLNLAKLYLSQHQPSEPSIDWLKKRAKQEGDSSRLWEKDFPGCQQAAYRAGAANTFEEVIGHIQSHSQPSEPTSEQKELQGRAKALCYSLTQQMGLNWNFISEEYQQRHIKLVESFLTQLSISQSKKIKELEEWLARELGIEKAEPNAGDDPSKTYWIGIDQKCYESLSQALEQQLSAVTRKEGQDESTI